MQAIGARALNQAVKAVAIARGFVAPNGIDLICSPASGEERTALKLVIEKKLNPFTMEYLKIIRF